MPRLQGCMLTGSIYSTTAERRCCGDTFPTCVVKKDVRLRVTNATLLSQPNNRMSSHPVDILLAQATVFAEAGIFRRVLTRLTALSRCAPILVSEADARTGSQLVWTVLLSVWLCQILPRTSRDGMRSNWSVKGHGSGKFVPEK